MNEPQGKSVIFIQGTLPEHTQLADSVAKSYIFKLPQFPCAMYVYRHAYDNVIMNEK